RNTGVSLTAQLIERFKTSAKLNVAITPEGTRARTSRWHTGFLHVALEANVPITLAYIDFPTKTINMSETFVPGGDISADMKRIKEYFRPYTGKYADKFSTDTETDGQ
ncbi:MAG: acyltransferase, partial [Muribaculaceae bacterium]|nr:acyltransferase [Muribaculaceae bacterium]